MVATASVTGMPGCVDLSHPEFQSEPDAPLSSVVDAAAGDAVAADAMNADAPGEAACLGEAGSDLVLWNFQRGDVNAFAFGAISLRQSGWDLFNDGTPGMQSLAVVAAVHTEACADNLALLYSADGYKDWGSGLRANLLPDARFFDAGAYAGLRFRVRAEEVRGLTIKVLDADTVSWGKRCRTCNGRWMKTISLTSSWTTVRMSFSEFELTGVADPTPSQIGRAALAGFEFIVGDGDGKRVWIDDVALFR